MFENNDGEQILVLYNLGGVGSGIGWLGILPYSHIILHFLYRFFSGLSNSEGLFVFLMKLGFEKLTLARQLLLIKVSKRGLLFQTLFESSISTAVI